MLEQLLDDTISTVTGVVRSHNPTLQSHETGTVQQVGGGIALVRGLASVSSEELVQFQDGVLGVAINLEPESVGVMLLGDSDRLSAGSRVTATGREADAPVGETLLGRVIDATGRVLDGGQAHWTYRSAGPLSARPRKSWRGHRSPFPWKPASRPLMP